MTKPPTAEDWVVPETDEDWANLSKRSRKRMAGHDKLPRDLRMLLYEIGELPDWQMQMVLTNLKHNQVTVVMMNDGRKFVIRPDIGGNHASHRRVAPPQSPRCSSE
jgi:hypothetical protein